MKNGYAFAHDASRCIMCYTCELACKQWKGISADGFRLRRVFETTSGSFPAVVRTFHSVSCQHCSDAPCVAACPTGAISRRESDGMVIVDAGKCDGCRECLAACPFDAPAFDAAGIMRLCDLCLDRLAEGRKPLCSDVCPTGALRYVRQIAP